MTEREWLRLSRLAESQLTYWLDQAELAWFKGDAPQREWAREHAAFYRTARTKFRAQAEIAAGLEADLQKSRLAKGEENG